MNKTLRDVMLTVVALVALSPGSVLASSNTPDSYFIASSSREGSSTYFRERYNSTIRRAIDKLDNDLVEDLPIPIFGILRKSIYPDFGDPRDGGARKHEGQDILAPRDSFIVSPTDAVVTRTGTQSSEGNYVNVAAPGGETFIFMHLDHIASGVKAGKVLKPGDVIGYVGNTGNAAGGPTHLHFEIRHGRTPQDPYPRLTGTFTLAEQVNMLTGILKSLKSRDNL